MQIIGAGFGRTGTTSLKLALEELGFGPCHHMKEIFENPSQRHFWGDAVAKKPVDWKAFFQNYRSTTDWPSASFYKELMAVYPDAKVILTTRDFDSWYKSCLETIHEIGRGFPMRLTARFVPVFGSILSMIDELVWKGTFNDRFLDREHAREVFYRHIEEVKRTVPAERLLVYEVKEGWEPLCRFLNVPVPEGKPFPRVNETPEFKRRVAFVRLVSSLVLALPLVAGLLLLRRGGRR
jgi:hypothetical protein